MDKETEITAGEYQALAEFRYQLLRFLRFSEEPARAVDLEPQQQRNCAQAGLPLCVL